jgi:hypothetical protein
MARSVGVQASDGVWGRLHEVAASIATRALASLIAGVLVLGIGGRLVMYLSRLLHPGAVGSITEGGNRVGEFTLGGSVGLVLFGGLFGALLVGLVWVVLEPWLPKRPLVVGAAASMIGSFALIDSENIDFVILRDPYLDVVLLVGLVFALGAVLVRVDGWLNRRLPDPAASRGWRAASWLVVALGLPLLAGPPQIFFFEDACCGQPPVLTGALLVLTAALTAWSWVAHVRGMGAPEWLVKAGPVSAWATVAAGAAHLAREIAQVFG